MAEYEVKIGVSGAAIEGFFSEMRSFGNCVQALVIWKDGEVIARVAPEPYSCADKGEVYSLSKSFCSTAIGMLRDEGAVSLDEKLSDLFPKEAEGADELLRAATVRDALTMRTGHAECAMPGVSRAFNGPRAFFQKRATFAPGTHFAYNTAATYMLSAVVQKKAGVSLLDYLEPRLFEPLGIENTFWTKCAGVNEGGIGLHVSADDIAKLGVLYIQGGVWQGRRLLSEEWVREAQKPHADNSMNGSPDWCAGYGYQFWCNVDGGYRGDGAFGQLCVILPESNTVVAVRALCADMQAEVSAVRRMADAISDGKPGSAVPAYAPLRPNEPLPLGLEGTYRLDANPFGWTQMSVGGEGGALRVSVSDGERVQNMIFGGGEWLPNRFRARRYCPKLVSLMDNVYEEELRFSGSYTISGGEAIAECRYTSCPHIERMRFRPESGVLTVEWDGAELRAEGASSLTARKL